MARERRPLGRCGCGQGESHEECTESPCREADETECVPMFRFSTAPWARSVRPAACGTLWPGSGVPLAVLAVAKASLIERPMQGCRRNRACPDVLFCDHAMGEVCEACSLGDPVARELRPRAAAWTALGVGQDVGWPDWDKGGSPDS